MGQLGLRLRQSQLDPRQVHWRLTEAAQAARVGLDDGSGRPLHQVPALPAQQLSQELPLCRVQSGQLTAVPGQTRRFRNFYIFMGICGNILPLREHFTNFSPPSMQNNSY